MVKVKGERGGPRTVHKDNSHPAIKIALRKWAVEKIQPESILDVYGGHGMMFNHIWKNYDYSCSKGDAIEFLKSQPEFNQDIFDIDPYSSPYEAIEIICQKSVKDRIGIVCTDGMLRRQAGMRGNLTKFIQDRCKWPAKDNTLMAGIYHQYPSFLRYVLSCICSNHQIETVAIKYGEKRSQATVYWAAILCS